MSEEPTALEPAATWDIVVDHGPEELSDDQLTALHQWCEDREIALPPAAEVAEAMVTRGLIERDSR